MQPLIFALLIVILLWWIWRQNALFCLSIRRGKILVMRGRVPASLLSDFRGVVGHVQNATIRAQKSSNGGDLTTRGLDAATAQRVRNLFGICSRPALRSAPPIVRPSLGQVVGIESLAWWFERRARR